LNSARAGEILNRQQDGIVLKWHFTVDGTIVFKHACVLGSEQHQR
jgi:hypothetical protein